MKNGKQIVFSALFVIALLISSRAESQNAPHPRGDFRGGRIFETLQLTDNQKATIQKLFTDSRENLRPLHQKVWEQRRLLREATQKQPFDESSVRFQAQELANLQAELMVSRAALMNQVSSVLTEEQRAKLEDLRARRMERFKQWRERRRGNPNQQQG